MSESLALVAPGRPVLECLPVGLFGSVTGLAGLSVAWRPAHARHGAPDWIAPAIAAAALIVFVAVLAGDAAKLATAFAEFGHPIAGNLFGTVLIGLLPPIVLEPCVHRPAGGLLPGESSPWTSASPGRMPESGPATFGQLPS